MRARASILLLLLASLVPPALAQSASLKVQVLTSDQTVPDTQVLIRLRTFEGLEKWGNAKLGNDATFTSLATGRYDVEVSALGYRTARTTVDVESRQGQTVQVVLQRDARAPAGADASPPESNVPARVRSDTERAVLAIQAGKLKEAEKRLRAAVKDAPQSVRANYLLGVVLIQLKQLPEAQKYLEQAIATDPKHALALTALGGLRLDQKDYTAASRLLEQAIAVNSQQWRPHGLLADVRLAQDDFAAARSEAELAIKLSDGSAHYALLTLGQALGALGRYADAADALERFLRAEPASPDAATVKSMLADLAERQRSPGTPRPEPIRNNLGALPLRPGSPLLRGFQARSKAESRHELSVVRYFP